MFSLNLMLIFFFCLAYGLQYMLNERVYENGNETVKMANRNRYIYISAQSKQLLLFLLSSVTVTAKLCNQASDSNLDALNTEPETNPHSSQLNPSWTNQPEKGVYKNKPTGG